MSRKREPAAVLFSFSTFTWTRLVPIRCERAVRSLISLDQRDQQGIIAKHFTRRKVLFQKWRFRYSQGVLTRSYYYTPSSWIVLPEMEVKIAILIGITCNSFYRLTDHDKSRYFSYCLHFSSSTPGSAWKVLNDRLIWKKWNTSDLKCTKTHQNEFDSLMKEWNSQESVSPLFSSLGKDTKLRNETWLNFHKLIKLDSQMESKIVFSAY